MKRGLPKSRHISIFHFLTKIPPFCWSSFRYFQVSPQFGTERELILKANSFPMAPQRVHIYQTGKLSIRKQLSASGELDWNSKGWDGGEGGFNWPFINLRFRQLWPCWKRYNWLFECILTCCATRSANMFCPPAPWAGQSQGYWGGGLQGLALGGFLTIVSARIIRKLREIIFPNYFHYSHLVSTSCIQKLKVLG